jgi:predicted DCC family thiol-disulfide oxidoreductase YuxK
MTPTLQRACRKAMHVVTADGQTLRAGRAALYVLAAVGYRRLARLLSLPVLGVLVELGYRVVATHRPFFGRLFFTKETPV